MISRDNYEIWFLDYFDGNLSKNKKEELFIFLEKNSDLKAEFDLFPGINLSADENIIFRDKEHLKRETITKNNYKTWMIALLENDLNTIDKRSAQEFIRDNSFAKQDYELLKRTKSVPDSQIVFGSKRSLRKGSKIIAFTPAFKRLIAIAALILFFAISFIVVKRMNAPVNMIANDAQENQENIIHSPVNKEEVQKNKSTELNIAPVRSNLKLRINIADKSARINKIKSRKSAPFQENNIQNKDNNVAENQSTLNPEIKIDPVVINPKIILPAINLPVANTVSPNHNLSDIFSEDDLADMGVDENNESGKSGLIDLAEKELTRISKDRNISFQKNENNSRNEIRYAFSIGNVSVSHTSAK